MNLGKENETTEFKESTVEKKKHAKRLLQS